MKTLLEAGPFIWPLHAIAIYNMILFIKKGVDLFFRSNLSSHELERGINTIVFWGCFAIALGFFAHYSGLYMAIQALSSAPEISTRIVAGGYAVSLVPVIYGLGIFMISMICWLFLRWRYGKTVGNHA